LLLKVLNNGLIVANSIFALAGPKVYIADDATDTRRFGWKLVDKTHLIWCDTDCLRHDRAMPIDFDGAIPNVFLCLSDSIIRVPPVKSYSIGNRRVQKDRRYPNENYHQRPEQESWDSLWHVVSPAWF
jgi:hypothetical protein